MPNAVKCVVFFSSLIKAVSLPYQLSVLIKLE